MAKHPLVSAAEGLKAENERLTAMAAHEASTKAFDAWHDSLFEAGHGVKQE